MALHETQARAAVVLENGRAQLSLIASMMAEAYSVNGISKPIIEREIGSLIETAIEYGKLQQFHQTTLHE